MILTAAQIRTYVNNAGFAAEDLDAAVAIARAESSGDTESYNPETAFFTEHNIQDHAARGRGSYGLFQIFRYEHPEFDDWNLEDPQVNAVAASLIYAKAGKKFTPWSTYTTGKFKEFLEAAPK